jgi:hypothetical protein
VEDLSLSNLPIISTGQQKILGTFTLAKWFSETSRGVAGQNVAGQVYRMFEVVNGMTGWRASFLAKRRSISSYFLILIIPSTNLMRHSCSVPKAIR